MASIAVAKTLRAAFALYREALPALARRVLPVLAIAESIDLLPWPDHPLVLLMASFISWLALTWAHAIGLGVMLRLHVPNIVASVGATSLALFALVDAYVWLTVSVSLLFFVFPGIVIAAATILAPVFALEKHQGPFEAVASSTDCAKGNLIPIAKAMLAVWVSLIIASSLLGAGVWLAGPASAPIAYTGSVLLAFAGLFHYSLVVVLFSRLYPSPASHGGHAYEPTAQVLASQPQQ
jgi:hypothetical protein